MEKNNTEMKHLVRIEEKLAIAKNMKDLGVSIDLIIKATLLSTRDIDNL